MVYCISAQVWYICKTDHPSQSLIFTYISPCHLSYGDILWENIEQKMLEHGFTTINHGAGCIRRPFTLHNFYFPSCPSTISICIFGCNININVMILHLTYKSSWIIHVHINCFFNKSSLYHYHFPDCPTVVLVCIWIIEASPYSQWLQLLSIDF